MTGGTTPYIPSSDTFCRKAGGIKNMFKYAVDKGWLTAIADIVVPDIHKNRKPTFTN